MSRCAACSAEVPIASRFCSACGAPVGSEDATLTSASDAAVTMTTPQGASPKISTDDVATLEFAAVKSANPPRPASSSSSRPPSSAFSLNEGRFLPGCLLAGRYRIIALLGKGGMGEVYRADDLTLGQPVALKFLPEEASRDESLLDRFRNEVRIARHVSHPNVCRVYDVGEVDGHTFFTMEYVDGEDLASLLRRIGRLPQDKALDIARQLCAGLAAAHAKGVLHRDLKPANIMLDGRGQVVMTDFGLAGLTDQIQGADIRSGTPAYMAPEQLAGKEVTAQSDLYSLGLVLYEVFTGKRAFTAEALAELVRGGTSTPSKPSSVVKDLDPAIERVILRCLEAEPGSRPESALRVAGALPGGDPLAAALAAGETPSPEMVAAAGETAGLASRIAMACLAAILIGLAGAVYVAIQHSALDRMGVEQSPEVLAQKAREMIARFGYAGKPADSFFDFDYDMSFVRYVEKHDQPRPQWDQMLQDRPSVLEFLYRQSPEPLVASGLHNFPLLTPGMVDQTDPAPTQSGMVRLQLDPQGRLAAFEAIPPEIANPPATATQPFDWKILFTAAELDPAQFQPTQPIWNSLASPDTRAAWTGRWPGTERPLRIEAAAFQGKPVYFYLIGDWTEAPRMQSPPESAAKKASEIVFLVLGVGLLVGGVWLARRNYRQGRGDREGALRLAKIVFGLMIRNSHAHGSRPQHRLVPLGLGLRYVSCPRTLRPPLLATVHHFVEPFADRAGARFAGRPRHPVWRTAGRDLDCGFQSQRVCTDESGSLAQSVFHRLSSGRASRCWRMALSGPVVNSRDIGVLPALSGSEGSAQERLAGRHRLCRDFYGLKVARLESSRGRRAYVDCGLPHPGPDHVSLRAGVAGMRDLHRRSVSKCSVHWGFFRLVFRRNDVCAAQHSRSGGVGLLSFTRQRAAVAAKTALSGYRV